MRKVVFIVISTILFVSCNDKPVNREKKLNDFKLNDIAYNKLLSSEIERVGKENLHYNFNNYIKENNTEYIIVDIVGDSLIT